MSFKNLQILILLLWSPALVAQHVRLFITKDDVSVKIKTKQSFKNEKEALSYLTTTQQKLIQQGYLEASFDSMLKKQDSLFTTLHAGKKYKVNNPAVDLNRKKKLLKNKTVSSSVFEADITKESLVQNFENSEN